MLQVECPIDRMRFDTESIGYTGPTMLIQYDTLQDPTIHLHNVFDRTVMETLELIHRMTESHLVGYHLAHDMFHLARTFNILAHLTKDKIPNPYEYREVEMDICSKELCLKPVGAVDLMVVGKKGPFQHQTKQKPILIRRTPRDTAGELVRVLNKYIDIPALYFSKSKKGKFWKIQDVVEGTADNITDEQRGKEDYPIDPDFVNIKLDFHPSATLKSIAEHILGFEDTADFEQAGHKFVDEEAWNPASGKWINVFESHRLVWAHDKRQRDYARRDVVYTSALDTHLEFPQPDNDSMLACMIGNTYWSGFAIDVEETRKQLEVAKKVVDESKAKIDYNSPKKVLAYFHEVCHPMEKALVQNTRKETLKILCGSENPKLAERARTIVNARDKEMEFRLLDRLDIVRRLHVTFSVMGTATGRMAGGDSLFKGKGSINPQGIKKGKIRSIFTLADEGYVLSSGDFDAFEVSIYDAVYNDPKMKELLASGKKIHAIWGEYIYPHLTYDEIMATDGIKADQDNGYYARCKNSFLATMYGAQPDKIAEMVWIEVEEAEEARNKYLEDFVTIGEAIKKLDKDHSCMVQAEGGGFIQWVKPITIIKSFFGLKRDFTLQYGIVKAMYKLACDPPQELKDLDDGMRIMRREKSQTKLGALRTSIYAAAFNIVSTIKRVAGNFLIQSAGGEITKALQYEINEHQPQGITKFYIKLLNVHDELQCAHLEEITDKVEATVNNFIAKFKAKVPLLAMKWKTRVSSWYEK